MRRTRGGGESEWWVHSFYPLTLWKERTPGIPKGDRNPPLVVRVGIIKGRGSKSAP